MATKTVPIWGLNAFMIIWCASLGLFLTTVPNVSAFLGKKPHFVGSRMSRMVSTKKAASMPTAPRASFHELTQSLSSDEEIISSADVDSDEDAEQRLGGEVDDDIANDIDDGEFLVGDGPDRWQGLLASTGLEGKLRHADLPETRKVSTFDIFCNRELKMDNVVAVGFDMVSRQKDRSVFEWIIGHVVFTS
jgi:hypothetical protein